MTVSHQRNVKQHRRRHHCRAALALFFCLFAVSAVAGDARKDKLCWAHYVGWGFDQVNGYDRATHDPLWQLRPFNDRSLLGRYIQCDSGITEGARRQIETARAYGIDGFCVDIIAPLAYSGTMSRFYQAAEGTDFKIALCIDNLGGQDLEKHLGDFLTKFGKHPNNCFINGKPVIFVYNPGSRKPEEWRKIRASLESRGLYAYYLVQPMRETTLWENEQRLADMLNGFDGLYDFGINGFFPEQIDRRLGNGMKALAKYKPEGILAAGITVGYLGQTTGFYRPFLRTGTLRNNWESAIRNGAQWVCLTTWNDYVEHTHFEPSAVNRDALLRINREYIRHWRGIEPPARPAELIVSYQEELLAGNDLTIELLNFSYLGEKSSAHLRLLDENGKVFRAFPPLALDAKNLGVKTIRIENEELGTIRTLRVQTALTAGNEKPEFRELYPIVRRPGRLESIRTVRIPFNAMSRVPVSLRIENETVRATLSSWNTAGTVELLRNGWPVAEREVNHTKAPHCMVEIPLAEIPPRSPEEVLIARYTTASGDVAYSNPVFLSRKKVPGSSRQPVVETGSDFDENWPLWSRRISRFAAPKLRERDFPEKDLFSLRYDFSEGKGELLASATGWKIPARLGAGRKYYDAKEQFVPAWVKTAGPNGQERNALAFDGNDDGIILQSRTMPYGSFTLEFLVKPEKKKGDGVLFLDQSGHVLKLDSELKPRFTRLKNPEIVSPEALKPGEWAHLAVVYDGKKLQLYINGKRQAETLAATELMEINSVPCIGCDLDRKNGYKGMIGGFSLEGAVRAPDGFQLMKQIHQGKR